MGETAGSKPMFLPGGSAPPTRVRWHIIALLLAFSFMSWFNRVSMPIAADGDKGIMKQFSISPTEMGYVYSALLLSYTLLMIPGGWLADRKGPWFALVLMGFGSATFGMCTGLVGSFFGSIWLSLMIIRFLMGAFTAPIYPASGRAIAHWIPFHQRAWMNGLVMGAALLGNAGAPVLFGKLIDVLDWQKAFVVSGLVTGIVALGWWAYAKDYPGQHKLVNAAERNLIQRGDELSLEGVRDQPRSSADFSDDFPRRASHVGVQNGSSSGWLNLLRNRNLVLLTLSYSAVGYFEYLFYFWIDYYFNEMLHVGEQQSRYYASIVFLASAAGMFMGGGISDWLQRYYGYRFGRAAVPVAGMLASAVLLGLGIAVTQPFWIVTYFALAMAAIGASEGPFWATAIDIGGSRGGASAGIFNTGGNAGGILAPIITPWVSAHFGWQWGISLGGIYCLLGVVLWWWIDPRQRVAETT